MARMLRGRDIVCVGSARWRSHLWTAEQHLAARLGRDNRVLFIEPPAGGQSRRSRALAAALRQPRTVAGLKVLTPPAGAGPAARALRARVVRRAVQRLGFGDIVLWGFAAAAHDLVGPLAPAQVVYDCRRPCADHGLERAFVARADVVLAGVPALVQRLRAVGAEPHYAPAVADTAAFARALADGPVDADLAALPRPRVVTTGLIAPQAIDVALVADLAARRPLVQLALVGPVEEDGRPALAPLRAAPNVHLLGPRPHASMPEVLRGADAALVPAHLGPESETLFPMHIYEHLAAGLGVVATPLPALAGVAGVRTAGEPDGVAAALDELLAADDLEARRARSAAVAGHSWDARLEQVAAALRTA